MYYPLVKHIKKTVIGIGFVFLVGCSGIGVKSDVTIGDQFKMGDVSLIVSQNITPNITYHTEAELQQILSQKIKALLEQRGLLSHQPVANALAIQVVYHRNFLNEQNDKSSIALAYPNYDYEIKVMDGVTKLTQVTQKNRVFKGRFIMNIDVLAGRLKKKSDEVVFIEGLAKDIVRSVQQIKG